MTINTEINRSQEEHERATEKRQKTVRWSDHQPETSPTLAMTFGQYATSTPTDQSEVQIPCPPEKPTDLVKVYYDAVTEEEAGNVDPQVEDDYKMRGENRRINRQDLTEEVFDDILRIQQNLPPINTIFIKRDNSRDTTAEFTPSSIEEIPATPDLGSPGMAIPHTEL